MLVSEAVAKIVAEGGADTDASSTPEATIRGWVNDSVRRAIARSKWRKRTAEVALVAGQGVYAIDDDVIDVIAARTGSGAPALRIGGDDLWNLQGGASRLNGATVAFSPAFDDDAVSGIELWPVPEEAGTLSMRVAVLPPVLVAGDQIPVPEDLVEQIAVDGPIATLLGRIEERPGDAQPFEARFEAGVQELSRRANGRVGNGAAQAKIWKVHF